MYITKNKTEYPVTVDEAKKQLRLETTFNEDDSYIEDLIKDATIIIENCVGFDIALTTNVVEIQDFTDLELTVYQGNLNTFTSVTDGNDTVLSYDQVTYPNMPIPNKFTIEFNSTIDVDTLKVNFTTGWSKSNVEKPLKRAILMKVSDLYSEERGSYSFTNHKYINSIERILKPYYISIY